MTNRLHETVLMNLRTAASRHADEIMEADHPVWDDMTQTAIAAVLEAMGEPSQAMLIAGEPAAAAQWGDLVGQAKGARRCWSAMLAAFRDEHLPAPPTTAKEPR